MPTNDGRLQEPDCWRITKSREDGGRLRLVHLRGVVGTEPVDAAAVARLVAGTGGTSIAPDPAATFAAIILRDLKGAADALRLIATAYRSAREGRVLPFVEASAAAAKG